MPTLGIPVHAVNVGAAPTGVFAADWNDLLWAALTVGRPNRYYVFKHGRSSLYEALFRTSLVRMAVKESPGSQRFVRTDTCKHLDPSEKGAINYFLGLTLCKAFAEKALQVPWMLHLDVFRNGLNPVLQRNERSRPDLVGQRLDGSWIAFESKGRVSQPDSKTKLKAKDQSKRVVSVLGHPVTGHFAGISYFNTNTLSFYVEDPEPLSQDDPKSISIRGEPADLFRNYYIPLVDGFFSSQRAVGSRGELSWYRDEETDTQVGIHSKLLAMLKREQWAAAGMFCQEFRSLLVASELHADGIAVKAGSTWRRANQRRDVRRTEDE